MMISGFKLTIVAAMLVVPAVSTAHQDRNRFGHDSIEAGQYEEAEASLRADLALNPDMPEALINLAAIYARTGRTDEAQALYTRVLASRDVSMLLSADRAMGSHAIAQYGLRKIEVARTAGR